MTHCLPAHRARVAYLRSHSDRLAVIGDAVGIDEYGARTMNSVVIERHSGDPVALACDATTGPGAGSSTGRAGPVLSCSSDGARQDRSVLTRTSSSKDRQYFLRLLSLDVLGFIDRPVANTACTVSRKADRSPTAPA